MSKTTVHRNEYVQSLATGLKVLESFSNETPHQTLSEVAERTGTSRATARRMLLTLCNLGYLSNTESKFAMTSKVLQIGHKYWAGRALRDILQPVLTELSERLKSSCSVSVLEDRSIVYVARQNVNQLMRFDIMLGTRLPALYTSMGRVLASGLCDAELQQWLDDIEIPEYTKYTVRDKTKLLETIHDVRTTGHTWINQELEYGLGSAAVPVRDHQGNVVLALNTAMRPENEGRFKDLDDAIPHLKASAQEIEKLLVALGIDTENIAAYY